MLRMIFAAFIFFYSALVFSDHHEMPGPYYAFYHFAAPDPAAVVAAMDKFWASDCGKKYPADPAFPKRYLMAGINQLTSLSIHLRMPKTSKKPRKFYAAVLQL